MKKTLFFLSSLIISFLSGNQLTAQILQGSTTVNAGNNMVITVTVNTQTDVVDITATGPDGVWFGYGFGGNNMTNRYAVITDGTGAISERKLGNHNSGSLLSSSFLSSSTSVNGSVRTTTVSRNRVGATGNHFTFPSTPGAFMLIWAKGNGTALSNHGSGNRGTSMITLNDICLGTIDTSVISVSNGLMANHTGANATYQWIDCTTNTPVPGQTGQTLVAPNSSDYRVVITDGNCVDSSACKNVVLFGVDEFVLSGVKMYPNPATNSINIELVNGAPHSISVYNSFGQKLLEEISSEAKNIIQLSDLAAGIYFIEVVQGAKSYRQKIVKQ